MSFEIFQRPNRSTEVPMVSVSARRIRLNRAAQDLAGLAPGKIISLLLDAEDRRIAFVEPLQGGSKWLVSGDYSNHDDYGGGFVACGSLMRYAEILPGQYPMEEFETPAGVIYGFCFSRALFWESR